MVPADDLAPAATLTAADVAVTAAVDRVAVCRRASRTRRWARCGAAYLVAAVAIAAGRSVIDDVLTCHEQLAGRSAAG
jgi:hypothetical protein